MVTTSSERTVLVESENRIIFIQPKKESINRVVYAEEV